MIGESFASTGSGFDDEMLLVLERLEHLFGHLDLALSMLVIGQMTSDQAFGPENVGNSAVLCGC